MFDLFSKLKYSREDQSSPSKELVVDDNGQLVVPPELVRQFGLTPGARIPVDQMEDSLRLYRPVTSLAKVYVEPTSRCNLHCRTCIRNSWDEPLGSMTAETYRHVLEGLKGFDPLPLVFFGGFGEPLAHPRIGKMVAQAKALGAQVELITNGILLDEAHTRALVTAGLDRLWVSLDGATPDGYTDVRLARALPQIIEHLVHFQEISVQLTGHRTEVGVAFVAMKRNVAELPSLVHMSRLIGASCYLVTNVLPYTADACPETLYNLSLNRLPEAATAFSPQVDLPRIDFNEETRNPLHTLLRTVGNVRQEGEIRDRSANQCPFILRGSTAVAWDGSLSPCLALLHNTRQYLDGRARTTRRYILGNVRERSLRGLWEDREYLAFRQRVQRFNYPPCTRCGGCPKVEKNEDDCFGNSFPTCGACLWAQGVIRCP